MDFELTRRRGKKWDGELNVFSEPLFFFCFKLALKPLLSFRFHFPILPALQLHRKPHIFFPMETEPVFEDPFLLVPAVPTLANEKSDELLMDYELTRRWGGRVERLLGTPFLILRKLAFKPLLLDCTSFSHRVRRTATDRKTPISIPTAYQPVFEDLLSCPLRFPPLDGKNSMLC